MKLLNQIPQFELRFYQVIFNRRQYWCVHSMGLLLTKSNFQRIGEESHIFYII